MKQLLPINSYGWFNLSRNKQVLKTQKSFSWVRQVTRDQNLDTKEGGKTSKNVSQQVPQISMDPVFSMRRTLAYFGNVKFNKNIPAKVRRSALNDRLAL